MQIKINGEQQFQVLATNFSISPSSTDYTLQISADGQNFSDLFRVSAGQTRMVTEVANGSYYRLKGNTSEVVVNWRKQCGGNSGGGSSADAKVLKPISEAPANPKNGEVYAVYTETEAEVVEFTQIPNRLQKFIIPVAADGTLHLQFYMYWRDTDNNWTVELLYENGELTPEYTPWGYDADRHLIKGGYADSGVYCSYGSYLGYEGLVFECVHNEGDYEDYHLMEMTEMDGRSVNGFYMDGDAHSEYGLYQYIDGEFKKIDRPSFNLAINDDFDGFVNDDQLQGLISHIKTFGAESLKDIDVKVYGNGGTEVYTPTIFTNEDGISFIFAYSGGQYNFYIDYNGNTLSVEDSAVVSSSTDEHMVYRILQMSQAEYDVLESKDPATLYIII